MKRRGLPFDLSSILALGSWAAEPDANPAEVSQRCQTASNGLNQSAQEVLSAAQETWAAARAALSEPKGDLLKPAQISSSLFQAGWHLELAARQLSLTLLILGLNTADKAGRAVALILSQEIIWQAARTCCEAAALYLGPDSLSGRGHAQD